MSSSHSVVPGADLGFRKGVTQQKNYDMHALVLWDFPCILFTRSKKLKRKHYWDTQGKSKGLSIIRVGSYIIEDRTER